MEYKLPIPLISTIYFEIATIHVDDKYLKFQGRLFRDDKEFVKANGTFVHIPFPKEKDLTSKLTQDKQKQNSNLFKLDYGKWVLNF